MKFRYTQLLMAGVLPLVVAGCAASRANKKVSVSPVETLTPDSASEVNVDVTINVPKHAFSRRSRLVVVPQLMQQDSLIAECRPLVLDAPVFYKKMKREMKSSGVKVVATGGFSEIIASEISCIDHVDKLLTLQGLKYLYDLNNTEGKQ